MAPTLVTACTALPPEGAGPPQGGLSAVRRRTFIAGATLPALAACGFQLRQAPTFAFKTLYTAMPANSQLGNELRRNLEAAGIAVLRDAAQLPQAEVVLESLADQRERAVVGIGATGQVREVQLRQRFRFKLRNQAGVELIPDAEILQTRDVSYSEAAALAKEAEEQLLYRTMQTDIVQQVMRRLAAVKAL